MSRSAIALRQQQLQLQQQQQQQHQQQIMADNEAAAKAAEIFDYFCAATTMRQVLGLHRNMCDTVGLRPGPLNEFYPKLKLKVRNWKAQALWKKFDARAIHRVYNKGNACTGSRVLVIGAGPCGLRTAIEAQLLGAKVVVVEKRDRISRNNVIHLWPFVITDLRNLGAKKFYGKFCAGSIDHISIRQLQCILLKVALLLGVEIHEGVSFLKTIEPTDGCGWRAEVSPIDHPVSHYEFDVLIGADGKRNTLEGFKRKEFRGKLAIAITANFINKKTEAEARVEEISGVAFIFNQSFFKELYQTTGIDLENIVYYKDETHYFVMTAKKHSLIDKNVIIQDYADPAELLSPSNVNTDKLLDYAREAAEFSTKYQMTNLEFAVNHYGKPDVAMFDFTSMFAAEASSRVIVRKNYRLLQCLVGDSLLEPFWPTGSGCARGFLSSMDAAYMIKLHANQRNSILGVIAQRESIYRLLAQTTPENLQRDIGAYTVDPSTRYPNLNKSIVNVWQVKHLIDTDDPSLLEQVHMDTSSIQTIDTPIRRKRRTGDTMPLSTVLLRWVQSQLHAYDFAQKLTEISQCFTEGKVLCALINRYRPDLIDLNAIKEYTPMECNELAFKILETEMHIPRCVSDKDSVSLENVDSKIWLNYLEQICEVFRGEIPHIKHPKLDYSELKEKSSRDKKPDFSNLLNRSSKLKVKSPMQDIDLTAGVHRRSVFDEDKVKRQRKFGNELPVTGGQNDTSRRAKKRRSQEKHANIEERQQRLKEIEANRLERQSKRKQQRYQQTQNFYKSLQMLQANNLLREDNKDQPFEDYSIYMYRQNAPEFNDRVKMLEKKLLYPDRDRGIPSAFARNNDEQFSNRIKSMEQQITSRGAGASDKKPKDLLRAIGKIDSNDWNIREIEKKIEQSKKTEIPSKTNKEKVPKWSKEQFLARQNKMSKPPLERTESSDEKFKEIDQTLKNLDKQLKEGHIRDVGERGKNKVASIAGQFGKKDDTSEEKPAHQGNKSNSKVASVFKNQAASEKCHFCKQTVYLMEKISTENLILHRSCLKCHHCHTNLRIGAYAFDRDDPQGRFYCVQHFRLPAKAIRPMTRKSTKHARKSANSQTAAPSNNVTIEANVASDIALKTPEKLHRGRPETIVQLDLLDRGQTPERIEFENTDAMSDGEPSLENIMDEIEWTDRNFLTDSDDSESDVSGSDESDDDSESFDDADDGSPIAQTLQLATDWIGKQRYSNNGESDDSDNDFYDSSEEMLDDGDADSQTEGEEFKKAREMRRQEVQLLPIPNYLPTDTETEVQSDSESSSDDDDILNSATEISTDSEFDHDPVIREAPKIFIDDTHLRKPTKVQIKQVTIGNHTATNQPAKLHDIINSHATSAALQNALTHKEIEFKPLVQVDPTLLNSNRMTPLKNPRPGDYLLNKTASTEGIASKKSLELKKRYLLGGEQGIGNKIMKSGSTSILDTKLKSFHSNISECQKLLNQAVGSSVSEQRSKMSLYEKSDCNIIDKKLSDTENKLKKDLEEKENVYINKKNELNKGMEYSETINTTLIQNITNKQRNNNGHPLNIPSPIIETIDLVSPEKEVPIIDLTKIDIPSSMIKSNKEFIENIKIESEEKSLNVDENLNSSIEVIDLTSDSPIKENSKTDLSNVKRSIPDIITNIDEIKLEKISLPNEEIKSEQNDNECQDTCINVPIIPWSNKKDDNVESDSLSTSNTSSLDDIPHYILDSTTSPDTQNGLVNGGVVPRLEVHDSSGTLMQIDSLMIIDGKYVGDPEDLPLMEIPEGMTTSSTTTTEDTLIDLNQTLINTNNDSTNSPTKDLKFDTKNENKIESLKNLPLIYDNSTSTTTTNNNDKKSKTLTLDLSKTVSTTNVGVSPVTPPSNNLNDNDKTPTANDNHHTDSDTEQTGQLLTETELSDWAADDAVSENFVDIEFVLNSNKGTIKRNKKMKKSKLPSAEKQYQHNARHYSQDKTTPVGTPRECGGILENLAIGEIDFMDTGSEGSCAEGYAATNKTLIRNRGYVEFIDNDYIPNCGKHKEINLKKEIPSILKLDTPLYSRSNSTKEVLGIDYIEQGACILNSNHEMELKTPVNEIPPPTFAIGKIVEQPSNNQISPKLYHHQQPPLSLTDSTNEIDDDSLVMLTSRSANTNTPTATTGTTTEESDALTVVTSPLDSSSPRLQENVTTTTGSSTTGSSAEAQKKVGSATKPAISRNHSTEDQKTKFYGESGNIGRKRSSQEDLLKTTKRKDSDEMNYEEYVRKLQQKITQISNAKDSIDVRKHKRKTSRGNESIPESALNSERNSVNEILTQNKKSSMPTTTITTTTTITVDPKSISIFETSHTNPLTGITQSQNLNSQPLVKPQITNEIHKVPEILTLSSKLEEITKERTKQKDLIHDLVMDKLQSKKQLNAEKRLIRSRNRSIVFSPSRGIINSNTSSLLMTTSTPSAELHHEQHNFKENIPTKLKVESPKENKDVSQTFNQSIIRKPRPFSENLDKVAINHHYETAVPGIITGNATISNSIQYSTPKAPQRKCNETPLSTNTEQLRADARERARLKSNQDLGLSPEEKLQMLRRKYHNDLHDAISSSKNSTDDLKARQRKMVTSKSVNDISAVQLQILTIDNSNINNNNNNKKSTSNKNINDFTSDPNLSNSIPPSTSVPTKLSRRQKDPERRKSLIQAVSNFFTKNKKDNHKELTETESKQISLDASNMSVFSRFRISPKSKEKSKEKDEAQMNDQRNLTASKDYQKNEFSSTPQLYNNNKNIDDAVAGVMVVAATPSVLTTAQARPVFVQHMDNFNVNSNGNADDGDDDEYDVAPPPIPPLPLNYQRSDDESYTPESKEQQRKQRALSKASRQAELKRIRIAQEIQREQEEIEVQLKDFEARGVIIEKALRGEGQNVENLESSSMGASDEKLLKELLEIWRNITQLKKRDEELGIRQQELKLEHRHAQLKDELNLRLSCSKLDKSAVDVAAEGAILNEMLEIVAKRAALRPNDSTSMQTNAVTVAAGAASNFVTPTSNCQSADTNESEI